MYSQNQSHRVSSENLLFSDDSSGLYAGNSKNHKWFAHEFRLCRSDIRSLRRRLHAVPDDVEALEIDSVDDDQLSDWLENDKHIIKEDLRVIEQQKMYLDMRVSEWLQALTEMKSEAVDNYAHAQDIYKQEVEGLTPDGYGGLNLSYRQLSQKLANLKSERKLRLKDIRKELRDIYLGFDDSMEKKDLSSKSEGSVSCNTSPILGQAQPIEDRVDYNSCDQGHNPPVIIERVNDTVPTTLLLLANTSTKSQTRGSDCVQEDLTELSSDSERKLKLSCQSINYTVNHRHGNAGCFYDHNVSKTGFNENYQDTIIFNSEHEKPPPKPPDIFKG